MNTVAFYDTKPYDREYFERAPEANRLRRQFHEFCLSSETAASVEGAQAVCVFVNDRLDAPCLKLLHDAGVRLAALRCAGFNNVDLAAAMSLDLAITRVPAYSPHAVAEHAIALLLALNRKLHWAYNRVREHNFSLSGLSRIVERFPIDNILGREKTSDAFVPLTKKAHTDLEQRARRLSELTGTNVSAVVRDGKPFELICETAETLGADLIVQTTHGHTGLKHVLLGSTAERVVRHAPCPVLTVRTYGKRALKHVA